MASWHIRAPLTGRVDLAFVPFFERVSRVDLGLLRSEVHQMFGRFSGVVEPVRGGMNAWRSEVARLLEARRDEVEPDVAASCLGP